MVVDLEVDVMLDRYLGTKYHSTYLHPSFGIGSDGPMDGSIELG